MAIGFCDACRDIKECPTCHEPVTGFKHVGVRGAAPFPSGIWHYAIPCGHRHTGVQRVQAGKGKLAVYNGGPLWQGGYKWQNVYWGTYWSPAGIPFTPAQVDKATADIETDQSYSGGLSEYNVGRGSVLASVIIDSDPSHTVDDSQIGRFIKQWIQAGLVPDLDRRGAYNIFLPPGVAVTLSGDRSCDAFCDFHNTDGTHFYTVEPYPCQTGCNQCTSSEFDTLTQGFSEEMVELKTDMDPGTGWVIGNEELCDFCNTHFKCNQISTGEYVNAWYSNEQGACWVPKTVSVVRPKPEASFSPNGGIEDKIVTLLGKAATSLEMAAYAFTSQRIANAVAEAARRGVTVTIVMDRSETKGPQAKVHDQLISVGASVRLISPPGGIMHNKFVVIDGRILEWGSYNYTDRAEKNNYENATVMNDEILAQSYHREFQLIFERASLEARGLRRPVYRFYRRLARFLKARRT